MKSSKKVDLNSKLAKKGKEASLSKGSKENVRSDLKPVKTESKKSLVSSKMNNAKQITIHLFSSTIKHNSISSKSTPMMSFKVGMEERRVSGEEKSDNRFCSNPEKEEVNMQSEGNNFQVTNKLDQQKSEKVVSNQSSTNKIKVNRKQNLFRKSITSKEDLYNYNSNNNFVIGKPNKNSYTPDSKKSIVGGKKKSAFESKPKSGSNFPFIENVNSPSNQNVLSSNYVLSTNFTEGNTANNPNISPQISPTNKFTQPNVKPHQTPHPQGNQQNTQIKNNQHHQIVSTIQTLGTILKSHTNNLEEIKKNPLEMKKLNELNNKLSQIDKKGISPPDNKINLNDTYLRYHLNDSRNLLMENNVIRRETFIDNNFNKKTQVNDKEVIMNEIYNNSNNRIKKYGILFDFINNNIKEITEMMSQNNTINKQVEEENNNTNTNNVIFKKEIEKVLNEERLLKDISYSFINSSASDIDFYRNLIDQTFNQKIDNLSNEMSTMQMQSKIDLSAHTNEKLDKTQNQFDSDTFRSKQNSPPNGMEENETKFVHEPRENKKIKINPHILLQHLKEKQIEKKKKKELVRESSPSHKGPTIVKSEKAGDSKCIIF